MVSPVRLRKPEFNRERAECDTSSETLNDLSSLPQWEWRIVLFGAKSRRFSSSRLWVTLATAEVARDPVWRQPASALSPKAHVLVLARLRGPRGPLLLNDTIILLGRASQGQSCKVPLSKAFCR